MSGFGESGLFKFFGPRVFCPASIGYEAGNKTRLKKFECPFRQNTQGLLKSNYFGNYIT